MGSIIKFVVLTIFVPLSLTLSAQDKTKPKDYEYERLAETQQEYKEVIKTGDSLQVAEVCYKLGKRYISIGDSYNAEKWLTRAIRILEPRGLSESLGKIYVFQTDFLISNNKFDEAIEIVQKAIVNFRSVGATERLKGAYGMLAGIHTQGNKARLKEPYKYQRFSLDSALYYYNKANTKSGNLETNTSVSKPIFSNDNNLVYRDTSTLIRDLKKAYNNNLKQKATRDLFGNAAELGSTYLSFDNFQEAKGWFQKALIISDTAKIANFHQKIILFKLLSELYKKNNNYNEALKYFGLAYELELKGISADRDGAISRIKIEYETQKKELALKEQQRFTKIAVVLGLFALIVSIVFFLFYRKYKMISRQNEVLVEEQNHRVKNNLQQVSNLIILQRIQLNDDKIKTSLTETLQRIEAMAQVQRRLYDSKRLTEIELQSYIPNLTESILQSYSVFKCQLDYKIDDFWLHVDQTIPLGLLLNEVITNSCKYAFIKTDSIPSLKIECYLDNGIVRIYVADNGPGFELLETSGFGLKLIKVFSERLKGEYKFQNYGRGFSLTFKKRINLSR